MWIFILIIFSAVFFQTAALLSLLRRRIRLPLLLASAFLAFALYPQAAKINIKIFNEIVNNMDTLSWLCTIALTQSLLTLVFLTGFQKRRADERKIPLYMYFAFLPPVLLPVGLAGGMIFLFNVGTGWELRTLAIFFIAVVFCAMEGLAGFLVRIYPQQDSRESIVAGIYLLMIAAAMFLPTIVSGGGVNTVNTGADYRAVFLIAPCMLFIVLTAMGLSSLYHNLKLNKKWKNVQ